MRHLKIHRYSFIHQGGAGTVRVVSSSTTQRNVLDQSRRRMVSALDSKSSALTMRPLCLDKKFEIETSLSYVMLLIATSCKLRAKRLCSISATSDRDSGPVYWFQSRAWLRFVMQGQRCWGVDKTQDCLGQKQEKPVCQGRRDCNGWEPRYRSGIGDQRKW